MNRVPKNIAIPQLDAGSVGTVVWWLVYFWSMARSNTLVLFETVLRGNYILYQILDQDSGALCCAHVLISNMKSFPG